MANYPKVIISGFDPTFSKKQNKFVPGYLPYDADLYEELQRNKNGYYKEWIEELQAIEDYDESTKYKAEKLKGLTYAARFVGFRNEISMQAHSGYVNLDVDGKDNPQLVTKEDFAAARDTCFESKFVVAAWLSARGKGFSLLVKIAPTNKEGHKQAFLSLKEDLFKQIGIKIDPGTFNLDRLRFVSYDPDMKIKTPEEIEVIEDYRPHKLEDEEEKPKPKINNPLPAGKKKVEPDSDWSFANCEKYAEKNYSYVQGEMHFFLTQLAGRANAIGMSYDYLEGKVKEKYGPLSKSESDMLKPLQAVYSTYKSQHGVVIKNSPKLKHAFAEAYALNRAGRVFTEYDIDTVAQSHELDIDEVRRVYEQVFEDNKEEFGLDKKPDIVKVEHYLANKYEMVRNIVSNQREFRLKDSQDDYQPLNPSEIWRELQQMGFKFDLGKVKALLDTDFVTPYDPFKAYFESLYPWDGQEDYIKKLASYIEAEDQEFFEEQFKKALIRSIACSVDHVVNRIVFTFVQQAQESGKSTFIRFLNPFGDKYITESALKENKDTEFKFAENFMYNMEELASLSNTEVNRLKAIISKSMIKERKPFAIDEKEAFRRCNFWASTNKTEFLTDTENTRWLCIPIKRIKSFDYNNQVTGVKEVNIHQVWSQAYALYKSGYPYMLTTEEAAKRNSINKSFELSTNERDLIVKYLRIADEEITYFQTVSEIQEKLIEITSNRIKIIPSMLIKAMESIGFKKGQQKVNGVAIKGYYVKIMDHLSPKKYDDPTTNILNVTDLEDDLPF